MAPYDPRTDWLVYVLVSLSSERTYVGIALDMSRRLAQHNGEMRGGASSTRAGRPWALGATYGPYPDRGKAQQVEARLKRSTGTARLEVCAATLEL
jgi:predicted GIY-YIG superfamily endonuclease